MCQDEHKTDESPGAVPNQFGREFIVVFTEHIQDYSTLELFLSTEEPTPVSVTISAPLEPETQAPITATVNQGEINSFAKEYIVVTCCEDNSCEIAVVSSVDQTNVTVYLQISNNKKVAFSGNDFYDGDTINITLNRYQAVQLQSTGDLSGSRVIASEPVGVFIGTDLTRIGSRGVGDFLGEQLLPSHVMGMDYFLMPFPDRTVGDVIKIVAEFANTKITFQEEDYIIAHAGGTLKLILPSYSPSALMSNKRIVVAQVSQSYLSSEQNDTDPSMIIIPPKEQWLQKYVFASPQLSSEFNPVKMAIVAESTCKNDVILDTTFPTLTWSDVGDVAVTYVTLTNTAHTLRVNTSCGSVWGYLYGTSYEKAWSMPIGWNMITLPEYCNHNSNYNDPNPNYNEHNSNYNDPNYNGHNSNYNDQNPKYNDHNPNYNDPNPNYNDHNSNFNDNSSYYYIFYYNRSPNNNIHYFHYCNHNSNYNDHNSNYNEHNSNYNDANYNGHNANYNDQNPKYNDHIPNYNDPNPNYNDHNSNFNDNSSYYYIFYYNRSPNNNIHYFHAYNQ
ncbi:uncharacterized protein [Haliotis cracherodii]|uniref:uncharacterized protein n=1 Tax=Haliotis cracherodii TaxID=6455 RepID=UPI0039EB53FF